jgi:DNA-directed RNA polymerase subunit RPC12/RpoP
MAEYIDREALKDKLHKRLLNGNILGWLCGIINEQPVADVVPVVHGRWECQDGYFSDNWKCSACGIEWFFEYDPTETETKVNYCPNCGARMDGERRCEDD